MLHLPKAHLDMTNSSSLIQLLGEMTNLQALLLTAAYISEDVFAAIISQCQHLLYFQYIGGVLNAESNEMCHILVNRRVQQIILASSVKLSSSALIPVDINAIGLQVMNNKHMMDVIVPSIREYGCQKQGYPAQSTITIGVSPMCSDTKDIAFQFIGNAVPFWFENSNLQSISLQTRGYVFDVTKPEDKHALIEFRMTLNDASYLTIVDNFFVYQEEYIFTAIITADYVGKDSVLSPLNGNRVKVPYAGDEFVRLASISRLRIAHIQHADTLARLFIAIRGLREPFGELVMLSGVVSNAAVMDTIPFDILSQLDQFQYVYIQFTSEVAKDHVQGRFVIGFDVVKEDICKWELGGIEANGAHAICFKKANA